MTNTFTGDDRLKKSSGETARGSRQSADADRVNNDGGVLSAEERRRMLRQNFVHEVLPTPPSIPGYHCCWLSTTSTQDSINRRIQMGYLPVKATEVPGFGTSIQSTGGQFDGCVAVNEMILFKLPNEVFNDLMTIYHHDMPAEFESAIYERLMTNAERDAQGKPVMTVEGDFERLRRAPQAPSFINR